MTFRLGSDCSIHLSYGSVGPEATARSAQVQVRAPTRWLAGAAGVPRASSEHGVGNLEALAVAYDLVRALQLGQRIHDGLAFGEGAHAGDDRREQHRRRSCSRR